MDHFKWKIQCGDYLLGHVIGMGSFGKVRVGKHIPTNQLVAVKMIKKTNFRLNKKSKKQLCNELFILQHLKHPNVVEFYEEFENDTYWFIITEYINGGELFDYLITHTRLKESLTRKFVSQLVLGFAAQKKYQNRKSISMSYKFSQVGLETAISHCDSLLFVQAGTLLLCTRAVSHVGPTVKENNFYYGTEYFHSKNIAHRDLKLENLLLTQDLNLKIIDFGLSHFSPNNVLLSTFCGTPTYTAPEILQSIKYDGKKSDIWSIGVIIYVLTVGKFPFASKNANKLYNKIITGSYLLPSFLSVELRDLIQRMLKTDPSSRISMSEIKNHPWFHTQFSEKKSLNMAPINIDLNEDSFNPLIILEMESLGLQPKDVIKDLESGDGIKFKPTYNILESKFNYGQLIISSKMALNTNNHERSESKKEEEEEEEEEEGGGGGGGRGGGGGGEKEEEEEEKEESRIETIKEKHNKKKHEMLSNEKELTSLRDLQLKLQNLSSKKKSVSEHGKGKKLKKIKKKKKTKKKKRLGFLHRRTKKPKVNQKKNPQIDLSEKNISDLRSYIKQRTFTNFSTESGNDNDSIFQFDIKTKNSIKYNQKENTMEISISEDSDYEYEYNYDYDNYNYFYTSSSSSGTSGSSRCKFTTRDLSSNSEDVFAIKNQNHNQNEQDNKSSVFSIINQNKETNFKKKEIDSKFNFNNPNNDQNDQNFDQNFDQLENKIQKKSKPLAIENPNILIKNHQRLISSMITPTTISYFFEDDEIGVRENYQNLNPKKIPSSKKVINFDKKEEINKGKGIKINRGKKKKKDYLNVNENKSKQKQNLGRIKSNRKKICLSKTTDVVIGKKKKKRSLTIGLHSAKEKIRKREIEKDNNIYLNEFKGPIDPRLIFIKTTRYLMKHCIKVLKKMDLHYVKTYKFLLSVSIDKNDPDRISFQIEIVKIPNLKNVRMYKLRRIGASHKEFYKFYKIICKNLKK
ncbi:protein kinase [Anaeramoeba flamelloides]|uniref:Protein kinase n=1 Tax=Anaeramoeba flamelloides TaxID=1746091 RepID=A0AAV7Y2N8_9EUKA|nr:protein kinase [Anaeramoeba flamelloides]